MTSLGSEKAKSNHPLAKIHWIDRAVDINKFHTHQLRDEPKWTIQKTAEALDRSIGSVSQDLLIAQWMKTHEKQLRRCHSMRSALDFIHGKQREMRLTGND